MVNPERESALRKHIIIKLKFTPEETQLREGMLILNKNKILRAAAQIRCICMYQVCDTTTLRIMPIPVNVAQPCKQTQGRLTQHPNVESQKKRRVVRTDKMAFRVNYAAFPLIGTEGTLGGLNLKCFAGSWHRGVEQIGLSISILTICSANAFFNQYHLLREERKG